MTGSSLPLNLLDKLWANHFIAGRENGASLIWVDRTMCRKAPFTVSTWCASKA